MRDPKQESPPVNGNDTNAAPRADPSPSKNQKPEEFVGGIDLRGRLDQFEAILGKGLDLAEAGVSLGVTILTRVGTIAQHQILERMDVTTPGAAVPTSGKSPEAAVGPGTREPLDVQEQSYCITNRLPLIAGGPVEISFSINNDSAVQPKNVTLRVEGFMGDTQGGRVEAERFTVEPAQKTIDPMDFEKFFLVGTMPTDVRPDLYRGWVVVASGSELRIPVVLVVTGI